MDRRNRRFPRCSSLADSPHLGAQFNPVAETRPAASHLFLAVRSAVRHIVKFPTLLAAALLMLAGCRPNPSANQEQDRGVQTHIQDHLADRSRRDLSLDEAAGGHVLRKHVGRTDEELRERLEREHNISGASTYTDRATAERAIGAAIDQNSDRIQRWLSRSGHANLVLDYDAGAPIGRTLDRGETQAHACSHAVVVLRYDPPTSYHVLTSYPECRP